MIFSDFSSYRFLLVDDFGQYRSMLKSILRAGGATRIDDAANAVAAIDKVRKHQYDVILCDYNLGDGQDGQQVLEEIKHRGLLPERSIFFMVTAENQMAMVMGVVEYRPDAYLSKPFTKNVLKSRLDRVISRRRLLKDIQQLEQAGDYAQALQLCDQRMQEHRGSVLDLARLKGSLLQQSGELERALQHYDNIIQAANKPWAKLGRAQVLLEMERHEQAEDALKDLIVIDHLLIEAYDLLAEALLRQGHGKEAEGVLAQATRVSPKSVKRHQRLAEVALGNGSIPIAEKACRAAIREGRHSVFSRIDDHLLLARIYAGRNDLKKLLQVTSSAAELFKRDTSSQQRLKALEAWAYARAGQKKQARPLFEGVIQELPGDFCGMPESFVEDLLNACRALGEDERDRISVNLGAAHSLITYMQQRGPEKELLIRSRTYLDRCMGLDRNNERYQQLEQMYQRIA